MKKAILILTGAVLIWLALALYFLGAIPFAEKTNIPVQVFDCLSVLLGFAGVACIVVRNDIKQTA